MFSGCNLVTVMAAIGDRDCLSLLLGLSVHFEDTQ